MAPAWLGLDDNSGAGGGKLADFVSHRIVYDRVGDIEPRAGELATPGSKLERGLRASLGERPLARAVLPAAGPTHL